MVGVAGGESETVFVCLCARASKPALWQSRQNDRFLYPGAASAVSKFVRVCVLHMRVSSTFWG